MFAFLQNSGIISSPISDGRPPPILFLNDRGDILLKNKIIPLSMFGDEIGGGRKVRTLPSVSNDARRRVAGNARRK